MLIAHVPLPSGFVVPERIMRAAESADIDTNSRDVPFGADVWITCREAWPHRDECFREFVFITLVIASDHTVGDALSPEPRIAIEPGSLIVVDPMVVHWLCPEDLDAVLPWVGVQWEVPRSRAIETAREIVAMLGGRWLFNSDPRYLRWAPQSGGA